MIGIAAYLNDELLTIGATICFAGSIFLLRYDVDYPNAKTYSVKGQKFSIVHTEIEGNPFRYKISMMIKFYDDQIVWVIFYSNESINFECYQKTPNALTHIIYKKHKKIIHQILERYLDTI